MLNNKMHQKDLKIFHKLIQYYVINKKGKNMILDKSNMMEIKDHNIMIWMIKEIQHLIWVIWVEQHLI